MKQEYAIRDERGELFGLPAATFLTRDAVDKAMEMLTRVRDRMEQEAQDAQRLLDDPRAPAETEANRVALLETVERWAREKPRQWRIVTRQISDWESV